MKKLLNVFLCLYLCICFISYVKAVDISSDFTKCEIPAPITKHPLSHMGLNIAVTIKDKIIAAIPHVEPNPRISKLSVKEGVFEGIDVGEWSGIVRFSPTIPATCIPRPIRCSFCGAMEIPGSCDALSCIIEEPGTTVEKDVFSDNFEGVDYLSYNNTGIYVFSSHSKLSSKITLINENCRGFFKIRNRIFAITSLTHGFDNCGKIYELILSRGTCKANKIADIEDIPLTFTVVKNTLYVVTEYSLLKFDGHRLDSIIDINWRNFIPGSIVYADNSLFIGMRRGWMCEYNLKKKALQWYQYKGSLIV